LFCGWTFFMPRFPAKVTFNVNNDNRPIINNLFFSIVTIL